MKTLVKRYPGDYRTLLRNHPRITDLFTDIRIVTDVCDVIICSNQWYSCRWKYVLLHYCSGLCYITVQVCATLLFRFVLHYCSRLCYITVQVCATLLFMSVLHYCSGMCYITVQVCATLLFMLCYITVQVCATLLFRFVLHYCSGLCYITVQVCATLFFSCFLHYVY